ncbi:hypothetical protein QTO34_000746 [Cnephaeus nilssonii]|uniref:Uncharacterized protein n=1 Tax=Cnephaeus nilssonii TaxID=3371016 RepID=A0AA40ICL0_CNENI|nr:hypothetical protein QTO34_000746 [Eptesicus nilssonii]
MESSFALELLLQTMLRAAGKAMYGELVLHYHRGGTRGGKAIMRRRHRGVSAQSPRRPDPRLVGRDHSHGADAELEPPLATRAQCPAGPIGHPGHPESHPPGASWPIAGIAKKTTPRPCGFLQQRGIDRSAPTTKTRGETVQRWKTMTTPCHASSHQLCVIAGCPGPNQRGPDLHCHHLSTIQISLLTRAQMRPSCEAMQAAVGPWAFFWMFWVFLTQLQLVRIQVSNHSGAVLWVAVDPRAVDDPLAVVAATAC